MVYNRRGAFNKYFSRLLQWAHPLLKNHRIRILESCRAAGGDFFGRFPNCQHRRRTSQYSPAFTSDPFSNLNTWCAPPCFAFNHQPSGSPPCVCTVVLDTVRARPGIGCFHAGTVSMFCGHTHQMIWSHSVKPSLLFAVALFLPFATFNVAENVRVFSLQVCLKP